MAVSDSPGQSDTVIWAEHYRALKGYNVALSAVSESLLDLAIDAMNNDSRAVLIKNIHATLTVYIQVDGTDADATAWPIVAGDSVFVEGEGGTLEDIRLIGSASAEVIGVMTYKRV